MKNYESLGFSHQQFTKLQEKFEGILPELIIEDTFVHPNYLKDLVSKELIVKDRAEYNDGVYLKVGILDTLHFPTPVFYYSYEDGSLYDVSLEVKARVQWGSVRKKGN